MSEQDPQPEPAGHRDDVDLRGVGQLLGDAVVGVTGIVEAMHRTIAAVSPPLGAAREGRARGIAGLVYRSVRGVTRAAVPPTEAALAWLAPEADLAGAPSLRREALLAALNGAYGDHLAASGNPLAISMRMRRLGRALTPERSALALDVVEPSTRILVLAHGLCMNDLQWKRAGHDHGASLARELGYTAVYLHYNSGRHVSVNGREFSDTLERLVREWPVPVDGLAIVGHSMGGLVSRSACHFARGAGHTWLSRLTHLVFLGTPHHGAPLERLGNRVNQFWAFSPYAAPFARVGAIRSAGVKDLRFGNLLDEDWHDRDDAHPHDSRTPVPLPEGVACFTVAATRQPHAGVPEDRLPGDGLVPVTSALGDHEHSPRALQIPASHRHIVYGSNHFDLLSSSAVYARLHRWLAYADRLPDRAGDAPDRPVPHGR